MKGWLRNLRNRPARPDPMVEVDAELQNPGQNGNLAEELEQEAPQPEPALPPVTHPAIPYKASQQAIDLLHSFEGLAQVMPNGLIRSYLCPAKVWTIGWGATGRDPFNGGMIGANTVWTRAQADERFIQHLRQFERDTRASLKVPTTQGQFDALVSFAYNLGNGALSRSTLLRLHNAGDFEGAANQFKRWNRAGGQVLRGLTRRREAEARLYRGEPWQ